MQTLSVCLQHGADVTTSTQLTQ